MNRGDRCCAPNSDWGGTRGFCFEPEGMNRSPDWAYVGEGRGGYEQMQTYHYVGEGCGTFEKREDITTYYGWRMRGCCIFITVLLALAVAIWFFAPLFQNHYQDAYAGTHSTASHISSGLTFDCS